MTDRVFTAPPATVTSVVLCAKMLAAISPMRFMRGIQLISTRSPAPRIASTRVSFWFVVR